MNYKIKMKTYILIALCLLCLSVSADGQETGEKDPNAIQLPSDSTAAPIQRGILTTFKTVFQGKPGRAAFYGLIIPGGGQLYNRKYWKAPIVWAADGAAIYWYIYSRNLYKGFRSAYSARFDDSTVSYKGISSLEGLRQFRNQFQLESERAAITVIILHLFSIIEAFTDRHLRNFDVDENLSIELKPEHIPNLGSSSAISFQYTF